MGMINPFGPAPKYSAMDEWRRHQNQCSVQENTKPQTLIRLIRCEGCGAPVAMGRSCKYCGDSND